MTTTFPSPPYHPHFRRAFLELAQPGQAWRDLTAIDVHVDDRVTVRFTHRYVVSSDLPQVIVASLPDDVFLLPIRKVTGRPRPGMGPQDVEVVISTAGDVRVPQPVRAIDLDEQPELRPLAAAPRRDTSFLLLETSRRLLQPGLRLDVSHHVPFRRHANTAATARRTLDLFSPRSQLRRLSPGSQLTIAMSYQDFPSGESPAISFHVPSEMSVAVVHATLGVQLPRFDPFQLTKELENIASSFDSVLARSIEGRVRAEFVQLQVRQLLGTASVPGLLDELHAEVSAKRDELLDDLQLIADATGVALTSEPLQLTATMPDAVNAAVAAARNIVAANPLTGAADITTWMSELIDQLRKASTSAVVIMSSTLQGEHTAGAIFSLPRLAVLSPIAATFGFSNADSREAGRRASFSLIAVGALLLLLLLRLVFQVGPEVPMKHPGVLWYNRWGLHWNSDLSAELKGSQEALVALLVFFPSILFTQVDRIGRRNPVEMRTNYVALRYLFAALVGPLACAGVIVGKAEPAVVLTMLGSVGLLLLALAGLAHQRFSREGIDKSVQHSSLLAAKQWTSEVLAAP